MFIEKLTVSLPPQFNNLETVNLHKTNKTTT